MFSPRTLLSLPIVALLALVVGAAYAPAGPPAKHKPPAPAPAKFKHKPAPAKIRFQEAHLLRRAYVRLAGANHDYDGHRVLAMRAVHHAIAALDEGILKNGDARLKAATRQAQITTARLIAAAKQAAVLHERQDYSDAQMRRALVILAEGHVAAGRYHQPVVLKEVDAAVREIQIALRIR